MKNIAYRFSQRLKMLRTVKGIKPIVMADRLSISETTYRRYERNESEPTLSMLYKIAEIFEIEVADLISDKIDIVLPALNLM